MYDCWLVRVLPLAVISEIVYCAVATNGVSDALGSVSVTIPVPPLTIDTALARVQLVPSTVPEFIVTVADPVFITVQLTEPAVVL